MLEISPVLLPLQFTVASVYHVLYGARSVDFLLFEIILAIFAKYVQDGLC